jgi:hypothetical protein
MLYYLMYCNESRRHTCLVRKAVVHTACQQAMLHVEQIRIDFEFKYYDKNGYF